MNIPNLIEGHCNFHKITNTCKQGFKMLSYDVKSFVMKGLNVAELKDFFAFM